MTLQYNDNKVGRVIRVEWDQETDSVRVVMEIIDPVFKRKVIHTKDFQDILTISGKDVMVVASRSKDDA